MNSGPMGGPVPTPRRRFTTIQAPPLLAALILMAGCGGGGGSSTTAPVTTPPVTTPPVVTPAVTSVSAPALGVFTASLSEDVSSISVGGTVNYTVAVTNSSSAVATLATKTIDGASVPAASLQISTSTGQTVYPPGNQPGARPRDVPPPPPVGSNVVTLQPGQSVSQVRAISVFAKADTYQAVATFTVAANSTDTPQTVTLSALPVTAK